MSATSETPLREGVREQRGVGRGKLEKTPWGISNRGARVTQRVQADDLTLIFQTAKRKDQTPPKNVQGEKRLELCEGTLHTCGYVRDEENPTKREGVPT